MRNAGCNPCSSKNCLATMACGRQFARGTYLAAPRTAQAICSCEYLRAAVFCGKWSASRARTFEGGSKCNLQQVVERRYRARKSRRRSSAGKEKNRLTRRIADFGHFDESRFGELAEQFDDVALAHVGRDGVFPRDFGGDVRHFARL